MVTLHDKVKLMSCEFRYLFGSSEKKLPRVQYSRQNKFYGNADLAESV